MQADIQTATKVVNYIRRDATLFQLLEDLDMAAHATNQDIFEEFSESYPEETRRILTALKLL